MALHRDEGRPDPGRRRDPEQEYFSDGLTEELLNALARIPELRVAARTSSFAFKNMDVPVGSVARVLRVSHLVEGSVRRNGSRLRITAQLVSAANGYQVWSATYDRELTDIFQVQEEIARSIVNALEVRLGDTTGKLLVRSTTANPQAYELYLKGRYFWSRSSDEGLSSSIRYFNQALKRDPAFALAYAGLADAYTVQGIGFRPPRESFPKARAAATQALRIDSTLAEAHAALAYIRTEYDWDWAAADTGYQNLLRILGRFDEAIAHGRQAQSLDPLSPAGAQDLGWSYFYARRYDEAIDRSREAVELKPDYAIAYSRQAMAYERNGMLEEAIGAAERAVMLSRRAPTVLAVLGRVYASAGRREEALRIRDELQECSAREYVDRLYLAALHTGLGDFEQAFRSLERAVDERSTSMVSLKVHLWHDPLRSDSRYGALLRKLGLD